MFDEDGNPVAELEQLLHTSCMSYDGIKSYSRDYRYTINGSIQVIVYYMEDNLNRPQLLRLAAEAHSKRKGSRETIADAIVPAAEKEVGSDE